LGPEKTCIITVTDANGGPLKITLNLPLNLQAGGTFLGSIDNSGESKVIDAKYKNLICTIAPGIPDTVKRCPKQVFGAAPRRNDEGAEPPKGIAQ
jgi:hypothetical protein